MQTCFYIAQQHKAFDRTCVFLFIVLLLLFFFNKLQVPLTFLLTALFALFAFVLAAELYNADGKEDCQNPKAHKNPYRC